MLASIGGEDRHRSPNTIFMKDSWWCWEGLRRDDCRPKQQDHFESLSWKQRVQPFNPSPKREGSKNKNSTTWKIWPHWTLKKNRSNDNQALHTPWRRRNLKSEGEFSYLAKRRKVGKAGGFAIWDLRGFQEQRGVCSKWASLQGGSRREKVKSSLDRRIKFFSRRSFSLLFYIE